MVGFGITVGVLVAGVGGGRIGVVINIIVGDDGRLGRIRRFPVIRMLDHAPCERVGGDGGAVWRGERELRRSGDLSENGGYQAAREEQGKNEGRINELIVKLRNAKILEAPEAGLVGNGSVVTMDMAGREMVVVLGSRDIAVATDYDVISPESPIGAAIMGAHSGDTVSYQAPNGREISVTIKDAKPLN